MTKLYLHIGTPKTGTTSIQTFMKKNTEILKEKGVVYPLFGFRFDETVGEERNAHFLYDLTDEKADRCMSQIFELAKEYPCIVLSDEVLWQKYAMDRDFWIGLKETLAKENIECRVIVYLRRQDEFAYAFWAQKIKSRIKSDYGETSFSDFLETVAEKENLHLDYRAALENIESALGREQMVIRPYEKSRFMKENRTIQEDFLQILGLEMTEEYIQKEPIYNVSIYGNVLEAKRYLNQLEEFNRPEYNLTKYLSEVQEEMKAEGSFRKRDDFNMREAFMQKYDAGNAEVACRYLKTEKLFSEPFRNQEVDSGEYTIEEITKICGRIMLKILDQKQRDLEKYQEKKKRLLDRLQKQKEKNAVLQQRLDEQMSSGGIQRIRRKIHRAKKDRGER